MFFSETTSISPLRDLNFWLILSEYDVNRSVAFKLEDNLLEQLLEVNMKIEVDMNIKRYDINRFNCSFKLHYKC